MNRLQKIARDLKIVRQSLKLRNRSLLYAPIALFQMYRWKLFYKTKPHEYLTYRLWENDKAHRAAHFRNCHNVYLAETINDQSKLYLLRDKLILLKRLGDKAGREFLEISEASADAFYELLMRCGKLVLKPRGAASGRGIRVIDADLTRKECDALREKLLREQCTLAEGFLRQHPMLDRVYDQAVAIIKIHTLNLEGNVQIILYPFMQIGANGNRTSHGGFDTAIDRATGRFLCQPQLFPAHAHLQAVFGDEPVPFYREAEAAAIEAAHLVPELIYACWDIAITPNGPVIIEGNGASGAYHQMQKLMYGLTGWGIKQAYDDIIAYARKRPALDEAALRRITETVFYERETEADDIDVLVVLGSTLCEYRARSAAERGEGLACRYIVSGGNPCRSGSGAQTEAEYLHAYLTERGVEDARILIDNESTCTAENIDHVLKLLETIPTDGRPLCVGIVTGGFHMKRVFDLLAEHSASSAYRFVTVPAYGSHTHKDDWYNNIMGFGIVLAEYDKCRT